MKEFNDMMEAKLNMLEKSAGKASLAHK